MEAKPHIFLANFRGLKKDQVAVQIPETGVTIRFPAKSGTKIYYLPYLGKKVQLKGQQEGDQLVCELPAIEKGGVVWLE